MSKPMTDAGQAALLQEFAAELTMSPQELAASASAVQGEVRPPEPVRAAAGNMDMIMRIPVSVRVVLGSATMPVSSLAKLGRGAVIPLDRRVGEPVDVVVNGRVIARGEVVVMDEGSNRFGLKLTEVIGPSAVDKAS
jgi:flagellar motor switch protein FliN/FliY